MEIKLIEDKKEGKNYQADDFKICYRYKDMIAGNNSENVEEIIYLITGTAEITIKDFTRTVKAPAKIELSAKTYHKIRALTDIAFILFEK